MVIRLILLLINIVLINVAFVLSFLIRLGGHIPAFNFTPYKDSYMFLTLVYMLAFAFTGVYKERFTSFWEFLKRTSAGLFLGALFSVSLFYALRITWVGFPTSIFLISCPIGLLLIATVNGLILRFTGRIKKKLVVIGKAGEADVLDRGALTEIKYIERIEDLLQYEGIDEVVICKRIQDAKKLNLLIYLLHKLKVNATFSPSVYVELLSENILGENSNRFLTTFIGRKSEYEESLIRASDIVLSVLALVLLSPLIVLIALIIRITSPGSVLYRQVRVTKDGGTFVLYKFKTMHDDAEKETGPVLAVENDPRVTKFGRFLRTSHLNELPQLINVMRGEMSLVGPRPERPHAVKCHKALREMRLAVKPGLTGLAQIRGFYDLKPRHKIKYDYLYIQRRSLLLNLYILLLTIPAVLRRKGW
ncbi:MAG: sugar transferase [Planctomycetota bacterium]|jgi:lipopolysaccharide/colanic/teichoic acid biosynthesis glycosyltransferase